MDNKEIFAERLRQLREKKKKTQKEFAEEVNSTPATISAYENATKNPSLDIVLNIAKKYHISIDWLCGLEDIQKNSSDVTYADVLCIFNNLLNIPHLNANLAIITDPNYNGPFSDFDPQVCAMYFDNDVLTELVKDWNKYRNVGDDAELNQNINEMWLERMQKKYSTPIMANHRDMTAQDAINNDEELPFV